MSDWNDKIIKEFRENKGVVGGPFTGMHLLLVTTTGAKSGEKRISPVLGSRMATTASSSPPRAAHRRIRTGTTTS